MKFMLIVHHNEEAFEKMGEETQSQLLSESIELTHQFHATGQYVHASPLQPAATAVMVRLREGKPLVTDGPFIETREQIAGNSLAMPEILRTRPVSPPECPGRKSARSRSDR